MRDSFIRSEGSESKDLLLFFTSVPHP
jgi:hypothetical protein